MIAVVGRVVGLVCGRLSLWREGGREGWERLRVPWYGVVFVRRE